VNKEQNILMEWKKDKTDASDAAPTETVEAAGDVETAGETTAADMISGPTNAKPVGADTLVKVEGMTEANDDE
jgi:hypothetical protein